MTGKPLTRRVLGGLRRRASRLIHGEPNQPLLLEMIWPEERLDDPPVAQVADGYRLRQWRPQDLPAYRDLLAAADMGECPLDYWDRHILPGGFFVIEHDVTGALAAACFASHHSAARHPRAGNLGWLAAHPSHAGRGLGRAVTAAVTARLIAGGYRRIYLETHDFRGPAIKIYLSMGWVPLLYADEMLDRWRAACLNARWPFAPDAWPR